MPPFGVRPGGGVGSRNVLASLRCREQWGRASSALASVQPLSDSWPATLLADIACSHDDVHTVSDAFDAALRPVFCVRFHPSATKQLAVADEDGWVSILDPSRPNFEQPRVTRHKFQAHSNAIFDLQWIAADASTHSGETGAAGSTADVLVTVSGDQTARGWDATTGQCLYTLVGHQGSVKTVRAQPGQPSVLVTGARDGNVLLYDVREAQSRGEAGSVTPTYTVQHVHSQVAPPKSKRKRGALFNGSANGAGIESRSSVTALVFLDPNLLLTGGASDPDLRAWDLRTMRTRFKKDAVIVATPKDFTSSSSGGRKKKSAANDVFEPVWQITPGADSESSSPSSAPARRYGVCSLSLDNSGRRLLASSRDHAIRLYDLPSSGGGPPSNTPTQTFTGHTAGSFYVKAGFSPCGRFIASGSSDTNAYVWDTMAHRSRWSRQEESALPQGRPSSFGIRPLHVLSGHASEVSEVDWNPHVGRRGTPEYDVPFQLASCSDDSTVRLWRVDHSEREEGLGDIVHETRTRPNTISQAKQTAESSRQLLSPSSPSPLAAPRTPLRVRADAFAPRRFSSIASTASLTSATSSMLDSAASPAASSTAASISSAASSPYAGRAFQTVLEGLSHSSADLRHSASRDRSLSPADRRPTDSARLARASSTRALELQLSQSLTVSPTKVQLARAAHSAARERRRLHAAAAEASAADMSESVSATHASSSSEAAGVHSAPASASRRVARMLAVDGHTLPILRPDEPSTTLTAFPSTNLPSPPPSSATRTRLTFGESVPAAASSVPIVTPFASANGTLSASPLTPTTPRASSTRTPTSSSRARSANKSTPSSSQMRLKDFFRPLHQTVASAATSTDAGHSMDQST